MHSSLGVTNRALPIAVLVGQTAAGVLLGLTAAALKHEYGDTGVAGTLLSLAIGLSVLGALGMYASKRHAPTRWWWYAAWLLTTPVLLYLAIVLTA